MASVLLGFAMGGGRRKRRACGLLLLLQLLQIFVQAVEASFPQCAILRHPVSCLLEGCGFDATRAELAVPSLGNEPGARQHSQVFGDGWGADGEGAGKLTDRRLALREPGEYGST